MIVYLVHKESHSYQIMFEGVWGAAKSVELHLHITHKLPTYNSINLGIV